MNDKKKLILGILVFGSIWGGTEALTVANMAAVGEVIPRSVVLVFAALLILSFARYVMPMRGSTLLIGVIAAGAKVLGLQTLFGCQLAGLLGQAVVLEVAFTLAQRYSLMERPLSMGAVILASCYANGLLFSFSQAYVFQNSWWLDRGAVGLLEWSFGVGSVAAVAGLLGFAVAVPLARLARQPLTRLTEARSSDHGI